MGYPYTYESEYMNPHSPISKHDLLKFELDCEEKSKDNKINVEDFEYIDLNK